MKKLFTIEDFVIGLVAALGYGFTFEIPQLLGYPMWLCVVICLVVGIALEMLAYKLIFGKAVQKTPTRRYMALAAMVLVFLVAQHFATAWIGMNVFEYVAEQYGYVIIPPLLVFAFNMALRHYRVRKIRAHYGDGAGGFAFDGLVKQSEFDELNRQNRQIFGAFDADLAVKTKTGVFVGDKYENAIIFTGIPYAMPPVGERRWKAPVPRPASEEVFEAKYFGASAIQVDYDGSLLKRHRQSEDCLTLNICSPRKKKGEKKPVIVIFHHGDFSFGGSADPLLSGMNFNKVYPDAVGVTFNYRLGLFSFIDFTGIPGGEAYPDALNLGLLDQIAALRWIKENIAAFGGDPERVTVMGFESGSLSICLLAASAQAKGLFRKAFLFYGCPMAAYETPEVSRDLAKKLMEETGARTMADLVRLPEERLKAASQKLALDLSSPTRDGKLIPADVYAAYRAGSAADVDFIIGIPSNERHIYKSIVGDEKYEDLISKEDAYVMGYLDDAHPAAAKAVRAYVAAQPSATEAKAKIYEQFYALSTYRCAKNLAAGGCEVRLLYWDVKPLIEKFGSGTVDVLATFLGNSDMVQLYGNVLNNDLAEPLQRLFRKFESGEEIQLHNNEIKGLGAIDWKAFPEALMVSEKGFRCGPIEDRLTDVEALRELLSE